MLFLLPPAPPGDAAAAAVGIVFAAEPILGATGLELTAFVVPGLPASARPPIALPIAGFAVADLAGTFDRDSLATTPTLPAELSATVLVGTALTAAGFIGGFLGFAASLDGEDADDCDATEGRDFGRDFAAALLAEMPAEPDVRTLSEVVARFKRFLSMTVPKFPTRRDLLASRWLNVGLFKRISSQVKAVETHGAEFRR